MSTAGADASVKAQIHEATRSSYVANICTRIGNEKKDVESSKSI